MSSSIPPASSSATGQASASKQHALLQAIQAHLGEIEALATELGRLEEDCVYRYYSQSVKVYGLQIAIERTRTLFEHIAPEATGLNELFSQFARLRLRASSPTTRPCSIGT
jgi:hypothetical protein